MMLSLQVIIEDINYLDKNKYKIKKIDVPKITKNILNLYRF